MRIPSFRRTRRPATAIPAPAPDFPAACADMRPLPKLFSPLIAEMMAAYCHTKHLAGLAQDEHCPAEYQLVARSIVQHVLEGWQNQTGGRGTIEDLLLGPWTSRPTAPPASHAADFPAAREHRVAS
ncbi:hypothetical protein OG426_55260 (plasmid) [Streptomyces canus]|uniref:hypothetical protein n=1 Tax=Streptomyces canus TaxID=58343 RepID=UPI002F919944|nr:hypothetical protein OG426_55260 [Streptomyces canus]